MQINTDSSLITLLDDHVVLIETNEGLILDKTAVRRLYEKIEQLLSGDYSLVINRRNKYKLMRIEVYKEANAHDRLRGIAIVTHQKVAGMMAGMEAPLSQKPFSTFTDIDDAIAWAKSLHSS